MFAGPNGSGKSTFNEFVPAHLRANYINPDAIEKGIRETGSFDFSGFHIQGHKEAAIPFLLEHPVLAKHPESLAIVRTLAIEGDCLLFPNTGIDSYIASALSDFIRRALISEKLSFTVRNGDVRPQQDRAA